MNTASPASPSATRWCCPPGPCACLRRRRRRRRRRSAERARGRASAAEQVVALRVLPVRDGEQFLGTRPDLDAIARATRDRRAPLLAWSVSSWTRPMRVAEVGECLFLELEPVGHRVGVAYVLATRLDLARDGLDARRADRVVRRRIDAAAAGDLLLRAREARLGVEQQPERGGVHPCGGDPHAHRPMAPSNVSNSESATRIDLCRRLIGLLQAQRCWLPPRRD
jgi:hypothetical protein